MNESVLNELVEAINKASDVHRKGHAVYDLGEDCGDSYGNGDDCYSAGYEDGETDGVVDLACELKAIIRSGS